jgi:hypothetical protein
VIISEKEDCYEEIYVWSNASYLLFVNNKIEHGKGSKDTSSKEYLIEVTMSLSEYIDICGNNSQLVVLYGANGAFLNEWYASNTHIVISLF